MDSRIHELGKPGWSGEYAAQHAREESYKTVHGGQYNGVVPPVQNSALQHSKGQYNGVVPGW
eukprot:724920-Rhodomonas_salina.1